MMKYDDILNSIRSDPAYLSNLVWGKPRSGHPEGSIRKHIADLETNLERMKPQLSSEEIWKLRVLIHAHDTFKPDAKSGVAIADSNSHASLAKHFLAKYVSDVDLLNIVQFHDEPYAIWRKHRNGGDYSKRLEQLLELVADWDLFLAFLIVDGCTVGKSTEPMEWFFSEVEGRVESRIEATWIRISANPELRNES